MTIRNVWTRFSFSMIGLVWAMSLTLALLFGFFSSVRHLVWMAEMPQAPWPPVWLWIVVAVLGWTLILMGYRGAAAAVRHRHQQRRMLQSLSPLLEPFPFPIPASLAATADWHLVSDSGQRFAFTWGVRHCHIAISQSLWQALDTAGKTAVMHHEAAHAAARDPLQHLFLQVLSDVLPLFGMRSLFRRYLTRREINADAMAIAALAGNDMPLISALKAAVEVTPPPVSHVGLAGALAARLEYMDTRSSPPVMSSGLWLRMAASSFAMLVAIGEGWLVWCHF